MLLSEKEQNEYAEDNLLLVFHVVGTFRNSALNKDDLISVGMMGFTKALQTFDTERGVKFSTYAYNCIKNEILHELRRESRYNRRTVLSGNGIYTDDEGRIMALEDILGTDKDIVSIPTELMSDLNDLYLELDNLDKMEQFIIVHRFGLRGARLMTQLEIGDIVGMSQPFICRLEQNIIEKLHKKLKNSITIEDTEFYHTNNNIDYINKEGYDEWPTIMSEY